MDRTHIFGSRESKVRLQIPGHCTRGDFAFHLTRSYLSDKTRGEDMGEYGGMEMAQSNEKRDLLMIPIDESDIRFAT
jgi:hypothetical protein